MTFNLPTQTFRRRWLSLLAVVSTAAVSVQAAELIEPFRDGDRVCFVGDEITESGHYQRWIELFYATRYPRSTIRFINCGIRGDTAGGMLQRLEWDVLAQRPTVVVLQFGMHDLDPGLWAGDSQDSGAAARVAERRASFEAAAETIVARLKESGVRVILLSPVPHPMAGDVAPLREALTDMGASLRNLAEEQETDFVDLQQKLSTHSGLISVSTGNDGIQTWNSDAHFLIAHAFLESARVLNPVSHLSIDLQTGVISEAINGRVDSVYRTSNRLTFTWTEDALPFPADRTVARAVEQTGFQERFNQQLVQVVGLTPGIYELEIDGTRIGQFSANEFNAGVNLALQPTTPQYEQAVLVRRLVDVRSSLVVDNLRTIARVEHLLAPGIARPIEWEEIRPLLDSRMEAGTGVRDGLSVGDVGLYPRRKANEAESWAESVRLHRQMTSAAAPRSHLYSIRNVR